MKFVLISRIISKSFRKQKLKKYKISKDSGGWWVSAAGLYYVIDFEKYVWTLYNFIRLLNLVSLKKMNSVNELLERPFLKRTLEQKLVIKALGRPTPDIVINQSGKSKNNLYKRKFNNNVYKEVSWICGCEIRNALFCFPCLLFGGEASWSAKGVQNLSHLSEYIKRHSENKSHMLNVLNLTNIGLVKISAQLDTEYRQSIKKRYEQVEKNRYTLSKIIDCIQFCGGFELALLGHDESETSSNPGVFKMPIDLMASIDSVMKEHIESNSVFKYASKTIRDDLLECMLAVCREEIKNQICSAKYVAIIVDNTADVSETTQSVLVLRYAYFGKIYERFWNFLNPEGQNAEAISECILRQIRSFIKPEQLIAQSFDEAVVINGRTNDVQAKIKEIYKNARFVHCYAHQLNLIMKQCASQNKSARIFFSNLSAIPAFFSHSPLRLAAFERAVARRILRPNVTSWNFNSGLVNVVHENKEALSECFEELQDSKSEETVRKASALLKLFQDIEFLCWLTFFHEITTHLNILYQQIQSRQANSVFIKEAIDSFINIVQKIQFDVDDLFVSVEEYLLDFSKRLKINPLSTKAKEVCDVIISQFKERFESVEHFDIAKLVDSGEFLANSKNFPELQLNIAVETYPELDKNKLKTELTILYDRGDFRRLDGVLPLLEFILNNKIDDTFNQLTKLLNIIVTIPMSCTEAERCFSTSKRIKTFLSNTMPQEKLNALTMLSIEKDMINHIEDFKTKVIEKFVSDKNRQADFVFPH